MPPLRTKRILLICLALACLGLVWWISGTRSKPASAAPSGGAAAHPPVTAPPLDKPVSAASSGSIIDSPAIAAPQSLSDLRELLDSLPAAEAVAWIRAFLNDGRDRNTGQTFEIAADGSLKQSPTFRTFLLDALAAIDPAAAAAISRDILAEPTTADEWALALRNVARAEDPDLTRDFLRAKTEELITNPAWQADPSIGYLNAFDVLVHTEAVESAPLLTSLVGDHDRRDLAHAAFLTLDRLVQRQPAAMIDPLAADTALAASRPEMTAQQIARADLRDDRQRDLVAGWLLSPDRTTTELNAFAGVFPNHNQFVSNNLLTRDTPIPGPELAAHDREVLEIVTAWQDDPAFQTVEPQIGIMIERLTAFTTQQTQDPK